MIKRKKKKIRLRLWAKVILAIIGISLISGALYFAISNAQHEKSLNEYGEIKSVDITPPIEEQEEGGYITSGTPFNFYVIDVGQAQALFVDYGDTEVLIDGGCYENGETVSEFIKPYVDGELDYVIATHSHADHIGGLPIIYENYDVKHTIYGDLSDSEPCNYFKQAAQKSGTFQKDKDTVIRLGENATLTIFDIEDDNENTNNNSVITLFQYGETYFFASGDAEKEVETLLRGKLPECDVVVAGHHGSSTSNTLLEILNPKYFAISAGEGNEYGFPHKETMETIGNTRAETYGTWRSGTIVFTSDGLTVTCDAAEDEILEEENTAA